METKPKCPKDLGEAGRRFWETVHDTFILDEPAFELLHCACRQLDIITNARAILAESGLTSTNRYGAVVAHPCVSIESNATAMFRHICRQLAITGDEKHAT